MTGERESAPRRGDLDPSRLVLVLDTATSVAVLAIGDLDGAVVAVDAWPAGHRHAEELLPRMEALLERAGLDRRALARFAGLGVGLGPGAFTGLRVGLATMKGLAVATGRPLVGIPTSAALLDGARAAARREPLALLVPAGAADRTLVVDGVATLLAGSAEPDLAPGTGVVAVDLDGRASLEALRLGRIALDGLPGALVRRAAGRLRDGDADDVAALVPVYVTVPRGLQAAPGIDDPGAVAWSPGPR